MFCWRRQFLRRECVNFIEIGLVVIFNLKNIFEPQYYEILKNP